MKIFAKLPQNVGDTFTALVRSCWWQGRAAEDRAAAAPPTHNHGVKHRSVNCAVLDEIFYEFFLLPKHEYQLH